MSTTTTTMAPTTTTTTTTTTTITLTNINEDDQKLNPVPKTEQTAPTGPDSASVQIQPSTATTTIMPTVLTEANSNSGLTGPNLQKVVLEDIKLDEYYNETTEESTCKQFKFQITTGELKNMLDNSVLDTSTNKPYRYLTGSFIKIFEKHVELFEKQRIPIQKRNNIVYEESLRNNTVYLRVNGDCKLCPKQNRVKYVFTIRNRPTADDKFVEVEAKIRGTHVHGLSAEASMSMNGTIASMTATKGEYKFKLPVSSPPLNGLDSSVNLGNSVTADHNKSGSVAKKRKVCRKSEYISNTSFESTPQLSSTLNMNTSPMNNNNTSPMSMARTNGGQATSVNLGDKNVINQIVNQITGKIMIKLDQINLKVNQISDRLYDLERKLDCVEVAEIQF